jgi:hypothetical protein
VRKDNFHSAPHHALGAAHRVGAALDFRRSLADGCGQETVAWSSCSCSALPRFRSLMLADLPQQQTHKFTPMINLKTPGVRTPDAFLAAADELK